MELWDALEPVPAVISTNTNVANAEEAQHRPSPPRVTGMKVSYGKLLRKFASGCQFCSRKILDLGLESKKARFTRFTPFAHRKHGCLEASDSCIFNSYAITPIFHHIRKSPHCSCIHPESAGRLTQWQSSPRQYWLRRSGLE